MEKYYFEKEKDGIEPTEKCYLTDHLFLSPECIECKKYKGHDSKERWIKCEYYEKNFKILFYLDTILREHKKIDFMVTMAKKYEELKRIIK